jgi:hypothetical protein
MRIDKAGRDDQARGVDFARCGAIHFAARRDSPLRDSDVAETGRRAGSVNDRAVADYQVVSHRPLDLLAAFNLFARTATHVLSSAPPLTDWFDGRRRMIILKQDARASPEPHRER